MVVTWPEEDEGADDCKVADSSTDADEAVDDDGDAGSVGDVGDAGVEVDAGRVTAGDADGDAVKIAPEGAGDDVDEVVGAAASMIGSEGMSMK